MYKQYTAQTYVYNFHEQEFTERMASEARMIYLNTLLNLQEDATPWNFKVTKSTGKFSVFTMFSFGDCTY